MADVDELARELSTLSPRELAAALDRARQLRLVDPLNVIADRDAISNFVACPFCGQRTDTNCLDYKLFLALISDAYAQGANSVFLCCEDDKVAVVYDNVPGNEPRDTMPARYWHQILAGIHLAFSRQLMDESIGISPDLNLLAIVDTAPDFDKLRRVALKFNRPIPSGLRIMCADGLTAIHFLQP